MSDVGYRSRQCSYTLLNYEIISKHSCPHFLNISTNFAALVRLDFILATFLPTSSYRCICHFYPFLFWISLWQLWSIEEGHYPRFFFSIASTHLQLCFRMLKRRMGMDLLEWGDAIVTFLRFSMRIPHSKHLQLGLDPHLFSITCTTRPSARVARFIWMCVL